MLQFKSCVELALPFTFCGIAVFFPLLDTASGDMVIPHMRELSPIPCTHMLRRAGPTLNLGYGRAGSDVMGLILLLG